MYVLVLGEPMNFLLSVIPSKKMDTAQGKEKKSFTLAGI